MTSIVNKLPHGGLAAAPLVFGATLFLSALLLFLVQPMVAKMLLPLLGGVPAVWNAALVFFQAMLLAGYLYAHATTHWMGPRGQAVLHLGLLVVIVAALPIALPAGWVPPASDNPIPWLVAALFVAVGAPFFVIAASAPLLQRWFAHSGHPRANDPYFLYSPSNLGGLLALLAYPTLIEPQLRLTSQSSTWSIGYGVLVVLTAVCGIYLWQRPTNDAADRSAASDVEVPSAGSTMLDWPRPASLWGSRLHWIALAFVPSSLLLGITQFYTTDIAAFPLLWVIPLAVYLSTFVIVFARRPLIPHRVMVWLQPILLMPLALWFYWRYGESVLTVFLLHLVGFFAATMVCHGELARTRPPAARLTEFYLLLSFGGVLGGTFNALIAPVIFNTVIEYPLAIALACLLMPRRPGFIRGWIAGPWGWAWLALRVLVFAWLIDALVTADTSFMSATGLLGAGALVLLGLSVAHRPAVYVFAVGGLLVTGILIDRDTDVRTLFEDRSYFGVYRVVSDGLYNVFYHGTTIHGAQNDDPGAYRLIPINYYYESGPISEVIQEFRNSAGLKRVAIMGLGAGGITCHGEAGEEWIFYEIDPLVEKIARDKTLYSYVQDCPPDTRVVLGDARLKIAEAPDKNFDIIIMDAFNSDSVPVHLLTREAIELYLRKLDPGGVLVAHISNRHIDLEPPLANLAAAAGLDALIRNDDISMTDGDDLAAQPTDWVVLARKKADLGFLRREGANWRPLERRGHKTVWTDDFSNLFEAIEWF